MNKRILHLYPIIGECAGKISTFKEGPRVDDRDSKFLALTVGGQEGLLDNVAPCIAEDHISILNFLCSAVGDYSVCDSDLFTDKAVDEIAKSCFSFTFRTRRIDRRDCEFHSTDRVALTYRKRPA